jgi:hypothetical protein
MNEIITDANEAVLIFSGFLFVVCMIMTGILIWLKSPNGKQWLGEETTTQS